MVIEANRREERGKNAARRLRQAGRVPAVLYGGAGEPMALAVDVHQARQVLRTAGHNVLHEIQVEGVRPARAMLKDWQLDPVRGDLLHLDLQRVAMDVLIRVRVSVQTTGEPVGVKVGGGVFERVSRDIEVECLPSDIPEEIVVDVTALTIGKQLRAADLPLDPAKVRLLTEPQRVIAHVMAPTKEEAPAPEVAVAGPAEVAAPSEPEVIKKVRKEAEEGEEGEGKGE